MLKVKNINEIQGNTEDEMTLINAVKEGNNQLVIMMLNQGVSIETEEKIISHETNENNQSNSLSPGKKEQIEKELNQKLELMDSLEKELSRYQYSLSETQKYAKAMAQTPRSGGERRHILLNANTREMQKMQAAIAATKKKINVQKEDVQKLEQQLASANEALKQQKPEKLNEQKSEAVGNRLLHLAAYHGHKDIVEFLVKRGADVTIKNKEGKTPYDVANNAQIRKLLLVLTHENSNDNSSISSNFTSPQTPSSQIDSRKPINILPDKSSNVESEEKKFLVKTLHDAAARGDVEKIKNLFYVKHISINELGADDRTALHWAAESGHVAVIRLLKELHPEMNLPTVYGYTALHLAVMNNRVDAVRCLVKECQMNVNGMDKYGRTPLHLAVLNGQTAVIRCLLEECGADRTLKNNEGQTPYDIAQNYEIKDLLKRTTSLENKVKSLCDAASKGDATKIKQLLKDNLSVNEHDEYGWTALHYAVVYRQIDTIQCLLQECGADMTIENQEGKTPFDIASNDEIRKLLSSFKSSGEQPLDKSIFSSFQKIPWINIQQGELIGSGGFGKVYKGIWHGKLIAIKQLHLEMLTEETKSTFHQEATLLASCHFPNIIRLYGICLEPGHYAMILEYMPKGSLHQVLQNKKESLPWMSIRWQIAIEIGQGLSYLHEKKIIHRDLKSMNVLLDEQYHVKITDFGLAHIKVETSNTTAQNNKVIGTTRWRAPELFKRGTSPNSASDVYSYGMVLWELASRKLPYADALDEITAMGWIKDGEKENIPADCPKELSNIIEECWSTEPKNRPTALAITNKLEKIIAEKRSKQNSSDENHSENKKSEAKKNILNDITQKLFANALQAVAALNHSQPICFISYSWGVKEHEQRVQQIERELKMAGIQTIFDLNDNVAGTSIARFTENIHRADKIILVGSTELYEKWTNEQKVSVVRMEIEQIFAKQMDHPDEIKVIPILLNGDRKTAVPPFMALTVYIGFQQIEQHCQSLFNLLVALLPKQKVAIEQIRDDFFKKLNFALSDETKIQELMQKKLDIEDRLNKSMKSNVHKELSDLYKKEEAELARLASEFEQTIVFGVSQQMSMFQSTNKRENDNAATTSNYYTPIIDSFAPSSSH